MDDGLKSIFKEIYDKNVWGSSESVSGSGSSIKETRVIADILPDLFKEFEITSILDIPCGDFNWMKTVDLANIKYIGCDILEEIISLNKKYEKENVSFKCLDITKDVLPSSDLILVRDCFVHFSYNDIDRAIKNINKSKFKYMLTTSFSGRRYNSDIRTGGWRPLNLMSSPFNMSVIKIITENCPQENGAFSDKSLILIKLS